MSNLEFRSVAWRDTGIGKALKYVLTLSAITAAAVFEVGNYRYGNAVELERVETARKIDELMEQNKNADRQSKIITGTLKEVIAANEAQTKRLDLQFEILKELVRTNEAQSKRLDLQREEIRKLRMQIEEKKVTR